MSDLIVLHNKGDFTIMCGGKSFKPKATVSFPLEMADRLLRLYPGVIEDVVAATELYKVEPETVAFDKKEEVKGEDKKAAEAEAKANEKAAKKAAEAAKKETKDEEKA